MDRIRHIARAIIAVALMTASHAFADPVATSSTTTTSSTALAACQDRVETLRAGLDAIAAQLDENETELIDHWPSLLVGTLCITAAAILSEEQDWGEPTTATVVGSCGIVGIAFDLLIEPGGDE